MSTVEITAWDYLILRCLSVIGVVSLLGIAVIAFLVWQEYDYRCPWDPEVRQDRADLERIRGRR